MPGGSPVVSDVRSSGGYIPTLDGWRAIAILLVLVGHGMEPFLCQNAQSSACRLTRIGDNGVNLFFALSGFLICSRLLQEFRTSGRIDLGAFYVRRIFRILPPAFAYLAVVALLGAAGFIAVSQVELWASVLFFRNYLPKFIDLTSGAGWFTAHFWSLSIEEHFYLFWPALLLLLRPKRALGAAIGLVVLTTLWRSLDSRYAWSAAVLGNDVFGTRSDVRLDGLLAGCVLAIVFSQTEVRRRLAVLAAPPVLIGTFLLFLGILHPLSQKLPIQVALAPILIASTVARPWGTIGSVLESRTLRWIGGLSYSLYLWQQLFFYPIELGEGGSIVRLLLRCTGIFVCASISYYLIERPSIAFGRRWLKRRAHSRSTGLNDSAAEATVSGSV